MHYAQQDMVVGEPPVCTWPLAASEDRISLPSAVPPAPGTADPRPALGPSGILLLYLVVAGSHRL
jgi:hypothetical protein